MSTGRDEGKEKCARFPQKVRVSGLPWLLMGWNNTYSATDKAGDCPIYYMPSYNLFGIIPIIGNKKKFSTELGVSIFRKDGVWVFQRDGDLTPLYAKYGVAPQGDPFGHWEGGMQVKPIK